MENMQECSDTNCWLHRTRPGREHVSPLRFSVQKIARGIGVQFPVHASLLDTIRAPQTVIFLAVPKLPRRRIQLGHMHAVYEDIFGNKATAPIHPRNQGSSLRSPDTSIDISTRIPQVPVIFFTRIPEHRYSFHHSVHGEIPRSTNRKGVLEVQRGPDTSETGLVPRSPDLR